jgi:P27 family predicted phage terminase small subunit
VAPTAAKTAEKMTVGSRGGGKHWTVAEVKARQDAEQDVARRKRPTLKPPDWLSEDALGVWKELKRKLKDVELLDNLDTELLAIYCDAVVHYRQSSQVLNAFDTNGVSLATDERIKAAQAWARIISGYAEKLGLSPAGRARLAKKKADKTVDEFSKEFN